MPLSAVELAGLAAQSEQPGRALAAIIELREQLDELEEHQVEAARRQGWSWSDIAQPLGVTRQAVHHKYAGRLAQARPPARRAEPTLGADARRCVIRARREANALGHDSVGTDHLLLGLVLEGTTADALVPLGLSLERARAAVVELRGRPGRREERTGIPISERARTALEQARREALRLGDAEIGARHVLLASLRDDDARARRVLGVLGVAPAAVEERLAA